MSGGQPLAAGLDGGNTINSSSPDACTISSVHNGSKLWTLDSFILIFRIGENFSTTPIIKETERKYAKIPCLPIGRQG
jgi:hypothetical protein